MGRGARAARAGRGGPSRLPVTKREGLNGAFVTAASNGLLDRRQNNIHHSSIFSLRDEAKNTELHHSWNSDLKLRHAKVNFVNACKLASEELKDHGQEAAGNVDSETFTGGIEPEESMANMNLEDRLPEENSLSHNAVGSENELLLGPERDGLRDYHAEPVAKEDIFFTDLKGSTEPPDTGFARPILRRSLSVVSSDSSEEIIVFSGRNHPPASTEITTGQRGSFTPKPTLGFGSEASYDTSKLKRPLYGIRATVVNDPVFLNLDEAVPAGPKVSVTGKSAARTPSKKLFSLNHGVESRQIRQSKRRKRSLKQGENNIFADYIGNAENGEEIRDVMNGNALFRRDLGVTDSHGWRDESSDFEHVLQPDVVSDGSNGWDSTDMQDLDDLSTSEEVQAIVKSVLSKRTRLSGVQYLIVWEGYSADDARWIPLTTLDTPSAEEQIRIFESQLAREKRLSFKSEDSDDSVMMSQKIAIELRDELEDLEDEKDLLDRKRARMTDEQIARLLSKQEELGLGSDELVLFDGDEEEGSPRWNDEASSLPLSVWNQTMIRQKKNTRRQGELTSASVCANVLAQDPYNGFDVMDHDRPSLRKKPKGHRGQLTLELSHSELENSLQTAWDNDRSKKKIRKLEREELRAQGLLGKKGKVDMKARYKEGLLWEDVKEEIGIFLISSSQTLPLPPMDPYDRRRVHEVANAFNLKSKSVGGGTSRFPILYKTSRTTDYDKDALVGIEAQLNSRRFMHRSDKRRAKDPTRNPTIARRARGGGFASAGVSYRDGEVVGAAAPEIGSENRGRTMLEKMGWSTGTALGAMNNKGIMQPVAHVVKTTKAGLG